MSVIYGAASDTGRVRDHNEDALLARPEQGLWVVADGMGGHSAGEVASAIAVREIEAAVRRGSDLGDAVLSAHHAIIEAGARGEGAPGMGSTVVALQIEGHRYRVAWVGDSRAYLWDGSHLHQLTRDHSYVQRLVDSGLISPEDALEHPDRNTIAQALGVANGGLSIDVVEGDFVRDQQILLCTDGLTGEVLDSRIGALLVAGDAQQKVDALVAEALHEGGSDNVTVVLISAPADAPKGSPRASTVRIDSERLNAHLRRQDRVRRWGPLGAAAGALMLGGAFGWWLLDPFGGAAGPKSGPAGGGIYEQSRDSYGAEGSGDRPQLGEGALVSPKTGEGVQERWAADMAHEALSGTEEQGAGDSTSDPVDDEQTPDDDFGDSDQGLNAPASVFDEGRDDEARVQE